TDHLQRFQRIGLERLLRPVHVRLEPITVAGRARGFGDQLDLRRAEGIGHIEGLVGHGLVGLDHRQGSNAPPQILGPVLQLSLEIAELLPATASEEKCKRERGENLHYFPAFLPLAARLWAAISSSSRYPTVLPLPSIL